MNALAQRKSAYAWLLLGIALTALTGNRYNLAPLAWIASVPWLVSLRITDGWRGRVLLFVALQVGFGLQVAKIVTEPIPFMFVPMFSVPSALGTGVLLLLFEWLRRRLGDAAGLVLFPALTVVGEWATASTSEMGSWGALAYTQIDNDALLQIASLFGLWGVSALVASVSSLAAVLITSQARWRSAVFITGALIVGAHAYGMVRLSQPFEGPLVTVAAVGTDLALGAGDMPSAAQIAAGTDQLFERTYTAASRGAALIVWSEGSTVALDEAPLLARGLAMAQETGADIVLAYVVPLDGMRRFENKYVWMTPEGALETYLKHHPVPGEGSVRGTDAIAVLDRPYGLSAGAICYDYDFPALAREHALGGAGVVAVPSSDWRGIDPIHGQMAAVRGIEGGFSVIRSVRWATSRATDAYGQTRGAMSWFEDSERVMIARVPARQIPTLYAKIGDVLPWASLAVLGLAVLLAATRPNTT